MQKNECKHFEMHFELLFRANVTTAVKAYKMLTAIFEFELKIIEICWRFYHKSFIIKHNA